MKRRRKSLVQRLQPKQPEITRAELLDALGDVKANVDIETVARINSLAVDAILVSLMAIRNPEEPTLGDKIKKLSETLQQLSKELWEDVTAPENNEDWPNEDWLDED
jgi:hypothetical protein